MRGKLKEAAAAKPWRICFKDVGGLLTPERARTLIPVVLKAAGDIPVDFTPIATAAMHR